MRRLPIVLAVLAAGPAVAVAGTVGVVRGLARGHAYAETDVPLRPVALVLGAQVFTDGTPSPFLAGRVERLLLSGDGAAPEYDEPAAMRRHLLERGVPDEVLQTDPYGLDTYDSCWRAAHTYGYRALTVVTQTYHLPRAVATARALGVDAVGVGDASVWSLRRSWRKGVVRDQLACLKTVRDLATRRRPDPPPPKADTSGC